MYGWRGKLGLLIPANNTVIEPEINKMLPNGAAAFATRMIVEGPFNGEALHRMEIQASRGIDELLLSQVDVIAYACMSTSIVKGKDWDMSFQERLKGKGVEMITAAHCTIKALLELNAKNVAILTPYPAAIQQMVTPYFQDWGLNPVSLNSLNIDDYHAVTRVTSQNLYREAKSLNLKKAQALCILATDLRTLEVITPLEKDLGIPVVSTNLAILWAFLKILGIKETGNYSPDCTLMNNITWNG
ncbi:MAG: maleate cis-trans isomerase family protein [Bacillota bacterium]